MTARPDERIDAYARLLVRRSIDVQPGMQVLIRTTPLARPLLEEIVRLIAHRRAFPLVRLAFTLWPTDLVWAAEAPADVVAQMPDIDGYALDHMDARISIDAPENTREASELGSEKVAAMAKRTEPYAARIMADEIPWVSCQFPTNALAQEAGMTLPQFEDFLYGACLLDWDAEGRRMRAYAERFEDVDEVRIVAEGTDLRLSLEGRPADVDDGRANVPGGEFAFAPIEDSAEGRSSSANTPRSGAAGRLSALDFASRVDALSTQARRPARTS